MSETNGRKLPEGITLVRPGDNHPCAAKGKTIYCVRAKRRDNTRVHEHYSETEYRKALAAKKRIQAEECAPAKAQATTGRSMTVKEFAERWRKRQIFRDPESVEYALKRMYVVIGEDPIATVNRARLEELQKCLFDHPYAYNTVELTMAYTKTVIRAAVDSELLPKDPTVRLRMPRRDSLDNTGVVTEDDVPTQDEALTMIEVAPTRWRYGIVLGLGLGLRVGEVLGVAPTQVNFFADTIAIDAQELRRGRSGPKSKARTVQMPDLVSDELRRAIKAHRWGDKRPLSTGARGAVARRDEFYNKAWKPTLKAAKLPEDRFTFHACRHYAASAMLARGVPAIEVAYVLGDTLETVSRVYAHWLRDAPSVSKTALNEALSRPAQGLHIVSSDRSSKQS